MDLPAQEPGEPPDAKQIAAWARRYGDALRAGDGGDADRVARTAHAHGLSVPEVYVEVIQPAMYWIGELWEAGVISVAEEHLATAISERVMAALYPAILTEPPGSRPLALVAAVEGEHHVLGARMAADVLEGRGHTVRYLGANVPIDSLVAMAQRLRPSVIGLSVSNSFNGPSLRATLGELAGLGAPVAVGGHFVPTWIVETGVPRFTDVLQLPERIGEIPGPSAWAEALAKTPVPTLDRPPASAREGVGTTEAAIGQAAAETAELARVAARGWWTERQGPES